MKASNKAEKAYQQQKWKKEKKAELKKKVKYKINLFETRRSKLPEEKLLTCIEFFNFLNLLIKPTWPQESWL